ncbi:MAG TPA: glycosyltransferase [Saprospiraceae bacterium]|nr:glycosyltransferase [Saprospiraceae bacterium]HMP25546.1 glycosyltransferase [Saprospiraceae bacterium]
MPRIICTVTNDLTYDQRMIRICTSLASAGYDVQLIGRQQLDSQALVAHPFEQKRLPCRFKRGKLFYIEYNIRLFFYLLFVKFDIICAVDLDTILPAIATAKLRRKRCVYDAHEYFTETPEVVRRPSIQRVWEWVARIAIPRVDAAYTVGEELSNILSERYGKDFQVVRNVPFQQSAVAHPDPTQAPVILYQGALNEGRGLEAAIAAMHHLEGAVLWLAGEGDLSAALRQMVHAQGLEQRVRFFGYVPPEDLRKLTLQATIGLNLLENSGLSYYYSLANKAFDYIQAGLPSLHMNFPEYQRLNEAHHVFLLLHQLDPTLIAHTIQLLLDNPERYAQLRANCLRARQQLIWEKEEARLLAIYAALW